MHPLLPAVLMQVPPAVNVNEKVSQALMNRAGGGAYTSPVYSPYDSNGNATSYNNVSVKPPRA